MAIGVDPNVVLGPTSTTGFYAGVTPPNGGYTIYQNKASGGPSIYCPTSDAQLITYTNTQVAGTVGSPTSYTTAAQCLQYYSSQTDKICVNFDYEGIVTSGSIVNIDAGFTTSYPKSGTTIYDLSGNTYNGTLTNGPTFDSANSGSIVFSAPSDQYININSGASILSNVSYTKIAWFNCYNFVSYNNQIISGGNTGQHAFWLAGSNKIYSGHNGAWSTISTNTTLVANQWYFGVVTFSTSTGWAIYVGTGFNFLIVLPNPTTVTAISVNTWTHVAIVRINGTLKVYVNGTLSTSAADTNNYLAINPLIIGTNNTYNLEFFSGYISNLRIVKGVGVYTGNFTVPTSELQSTQSASTNIQAITSGQVQLLVKP